MLRLHLRTLRAEGLGAHEEALLLKRVLIWL